MRPVNKGKREQEYKPYQTAKENFLKRLAHIAPIVNVLLNSVEQLNTYSPKAK